MKILVDENLPPSLGRRLADLFPTLHHVRELGRLGSSDAELWRFARAHEYAAIFTADADFQKLALELGAPPKVIRIERCNFSATEIAELIRREAIRITDFVGSPHSLLILRR